MTNCPNYQTIKENIAKLLELNKGLYTMNREQIFNFVAEITFVSDDLAEFIRDINRHISDIENDTRSRCQDCSASMLAQMIKTNTLTLMADKDWANRQLRLMDNLRITALAAQKTTE